MSKSLYSFENSTFTIEDPTLNLFHKEKWSPITIPEKRIRGQESKQGHYLEIYANGGTPYAYAWIKDKRMDGEYILVYADSTIKGRQYYKEGHLHGPSTYYTAKGHVLSEAWFINGLQEGKSNWYYSDGIIYSRQIHKKGLWDGQQIFYYRDGTIKTELSYKNGRLHGTTKLYFPDGAPERILDYDDGKLLKADILAPALKKR